MKHTTHDENELQQRLSVGLETREPTSGAPAVAPGPPKAALILDQEVCNSPSLPDAGDHEVVIKPVWRGGKLDPYGRGGGRMKDLRKFEHLGGRMKIAIMVTITTRRDIFGGDPEKIYTHQMPLISKLLSERLGIKIWTRIIEAQTNSGDGFIHWHILADLAGTRYELRPGWVDLRAFNADLKRWWVDKWQLAKGFNTQLVRDRKRIVGYVAKYLVKPWPAIPTWIGEKIYGPRLVGFSKAASAMLREAGLTKERQPSAETEKTRASPVTIFERMASSGLTCKAVTCRSYAGEVNGPLVALSFLRQNGVAKAHGIELEDKTRTYMGTRGPVARPVLVLKNPSLRVLDKLNDLLAKSGVPALLQQIYEQRLQSLREGWHMMQARAA